MPCHDEFIEQIAGEEFSFEINEAENNGTEDVDNLAGEQTANAEVTAPAKNSKKRIKRGRPKKQIPNSKGSDKKMNPVALPAKQGDQHHCSQCDKTFTRATHLKRHMTIHSEERPFSCNLCEKKFRRADHLSEYSRS